MANTHFQTLLAKTPVLPVVTIQRAEDTLPLAEALVAGGLTAIEVTLRTSSALSAIEAIAREFPQLSVGAGTVLSEYNAREALAAGANFLVSPGIVPELLEGETPLPYLPGVATPSEMMRVLATGLTEAKLFPAAAIGGVQLLKAVASPLSELKFCPTGGINQTNLSDYLALSNVFAVGGSWMVEEKLIREKDWQAITNLCLAISEKTAHE